MNNLYTMYIDFSGSFVKPNHSTKYDRTFPRYTPLLTRNKYNHAHFISMPPYLFLLNVMSTGFQNFMIAQSKVHIDQGQVPT